MAQNRVPSQDVWDYLHRLERRLEAVEGRTLRNVVIPEGGVRIRGGGELVAETPDGVAMFYLGELVVAGVPFRGIVMRREDGSAMFYTSIPGSDPSKIFWAWLDQVGNICVSNDAQSGEGLARPYLATPAARAKFTSWEFTTSATFEALWHVRHFKQHPKVRGRLYATTDASGTTGEWRIIIAHTGAVIATGTVGFGQGPQEWGPVALPGDIYSDITLTIEVRRTAGSGNVRVEHQYTAGVQS